MRDYQGCSFAIVDDAATRRALSVIDYYLRDASRGFGRIQQGQVPDGSGDPLPIPPSSPSLLDYLFLPGRSGGQTLFTVTGDTSPTFQIQAAGPTGILERLAQGTGINVTNCVSNGTTTVTHGSSGFSVLSNGMLISGSLVPSGTTITAIASDGSLTASVAIPAGTTTMTFRHRIDLSFEANGAGNDGVMRISSGFQIIASSRDGGFGSGLRIAVQTALGSLIRTFLEASPGSDSMALAGTNAATGTSLHQLFTYNCVNSWTGTALSNLARLGVNVDPYEFRSSAAASQPGSLIVARRTGENASVPTVLIEGASATTMALALAGSSIGSDPNRTVGTPIAGFRHNGDLVMFNSSTAVGLLNGTAIGSLVPVMLLAGAADGLKYLAIGSVGSWSDGLTSATSKVMLLGDLSSTHRAFYLASAGFSLFTRFGISSSYTLISNATPAAAGFLAPEATPTVLRVVNAATTGADGSVLMKLQSNRAGQSGDFLECIDSTPTTLGGITAAGAYYLVANAGSGKVFVSDVNGVGSWVAPSALTASFSDALFSLFDDATPSKLMKFQLSGISAATTRTLTVQDFDGTIAILEQPQTALAKWDFQAGGLNALGTFGGTVDVLSDVGNIRIVDPVSGFVLELGCVTLTADHTITFLDGGGSVVTGGVSAFLVGNNNSRFTSVTASSGASFADSTTSTKRLRMVLSGAVGNNSITLTNTAARNYGLGNLSGNVVVVGDDPPAVASGALGKVDLTAQTAAIGSTNLSNTPPAGFYVVHVVAECTTVSGSGAPTLDFNLAWTDTVGATNRNATAEPGATAFPLPLSATGRSSASFVIQVASGNIAYTTTINAASGTPQYALYIRVVALG